VRLNALVIGGDGFVGKRLVSALVERGDRVVSTSRRGAARSDWAAVPVWPLDLLQLDNLALSLKLPPEPDISPWVMYIVAAITKVVDCEGSQNSWRINADAPVHLARRAFAANMYPVFISSDAVERAPHLAYSKQKAYAETVVLALGGAVVRPARITEPSLNELVALLIKVGEQTTAGGLYRWPG
jgi:dTDP-4-dehydrorhamnose reductase